mmetsp:Transcript_9152/g.28391  ORF Transcript_9152/g.28391 Transcript_9152/m.28391 type:complete len:142 (-) Transcript_9152:448-873(-)|eukprot:CAMPEP_0119165338 /NCGR_PEP_ID=MMETSP1315-20130426/5027_1 /TAXON_ID=676789 /ORGANISM="Prasinoderma singularis, Strain RCC927" /LENGTH=141 /DNA_ID=CAMNT_0007158601 /DNA_START=65 /DNA_END=490 /DNA_ORIENTATION=-
MEGGRGRRGCSASALAFVACLAAGCALAWSVRPTGGVGGGGSVSDALATPCNCTTLPGDAVECPSGQVMQVRLCLVLLARRPAAGVGPSPRSGTPGTLEEGVPLHTDPPCRASLIAGPAGGSPLLQPPARQQHKLTGAVAG